MYGLSDRDYLLAAVPPNSVTVEFINFHSAYKSDKERHFFNLFSKCIRISFAGTYRDFERGVFKFQFNDTQDYLHMIISEGSRELHFFSRYNKVVVAAKSDEDVDMLSTMALMVL